MGRDTLVPMKFKVFLTLAAIWVVLQSRVGSQLLECRKCYPHAVTAPEIQEIGEHHGHCETNRTPVVAPMVQIPTPTPTPLPGLSPKNPTEAALFSVFLPGSGQVYAGDPIKGIVFASLFGIGLWQTLDNLQLVDGRA